MHQSPLDFPSESTSRRWVPLTNANRALFLPWQLNKLDNSAWIRRLGVRVALRSRHFLSQNRWHFHKNTRSCVENECCCPRTVNISNVNFTSKISNISHPEKAAEQTVISNVYMTSLLCFSCVFQSGVTRPVGTKPQQSPVITRVPQKASWKRPSCQCYCLPHSPGF